MAGSRIEGKFHIITGQVTAIKNIHKCVERAGLNVRNLILEPLASSASVLDEEEKTAGVALVDIGGGTTDIAIFHDGIIRHTAVIPFGGNIVTRDIKDGCKIMVDQAEKLKIGFGSAVAKMVPENEIVTMRGLKGRPHREISMRNLAYIIEARMEEIIDRVYFEIRSSGYEEKLAGGIVLTGGGSQLKNLKHLVEYHTGMYARPGLPNERLAKSEVDGLQNPIFATGIGLILKGYEDRSYCQPSGNGSHVLEEDLIENETEVREEPELSGIESKKKSMFANFKVLVEEWLEDDD